MATELPTQAHRGNLAELRQTTPPTAAPVPAAQPSTAASPEYRASHYMGDPNNPDSRAGIAEKNRIAYENEAARKMKEKQKSCPSTGKVVLAGLRIGATTAATVLLPVVGGLAVGAADEVITHTTNAGDPIDVIQNSLKSVCRRPKSHIAPT